MKLQSTQSAGGERHFDVTQEEREKEKITCSDDNSLCCVAQFSFCPWDRVCKNHL
jgi:hypothetical protein